MESRWAIEFFSNQFLFSRPCDSTWLDNAEKELGQETRPPVQAFNAGFCLHRSFEEELQSINQPTLIISGTKDGRQRQEYLRFVKNCQMESLSGRYVLPWESTSEIVKTVKRFFLKA